MEMCLDACRGQIDDPRKLNRLNNATVDPQCAAMQTIGKYMYLRLRRWILQLSSQMQQRYVESALLHWTWFRETAHRMDSGPV